jgi:superfamily II DNA or RNA helicase
MVPLPSNLKMYLKDAMQSIEKGLIKDVEFADATYQVLVDDLNNHKPCWVFLQLENRREIKDSICSCEENNEWEPISACLHVAAAYLSLFKGHTLPLHQRFARSLWNHVCRLYAEQLGGNPLVLTRGGPGHYSYQISAEIPIFFVKAKTEKAIEHLESLISNRPEETEETSIKFSNLSEEEILKWQEGNPSSHLRYELSFWSDLAKWLIRLQEKDEKYEISFKYSKERLPNWIGINFDEVELGFYLSETDLPSIIPSLSTVESPLKVYYDNNEGISCIIYNKNEGALYIEAETINEPPHVKKRSAGTKAIGLDGWTYVLGEGFFAEEPHILLQTPVLKEEELSNALSEYGRFISKFLIDCEIHLRPVSPSYKLSFDKKWNLHIASYLFKPGDLSEEHSRLIGDWAYIEEGGFYHLENKRFEEAETVIPVHQVSDFLSQNRSWINAQESFQTHVRSLEYQLGYTLTASNRLNFDKALSRVKSGTKQHDFGSWVYLEGHGFFPKSMSSFGFLVRPGISLSAEQIPLFIKMNRDELALIPKFFSSLCPIIKSGLRVELTEALSIKVTPHYDLLPSYSNKVIKWFDEFVYVEGEGFHDIPAHLRLPEKFRVAHELNEEERGLFLQFEMDEIEGQIVYLDPRLTKIKTPELVTQAVLPANDRGRGWYRLALYYKTERGLISVADLWKSIKNKKQIFSFFKSGFIDLREERFEWVRQLKKDRLESRDLILLTSLEFMRLNAFDPIEFIAAESSSNEADRALLQELTHFRTPEEPDMGGLLSDLRPYQEIGVKWLWFLYHQQLSGLLCDDMGLGKTHQAMALLTSVNNYYQAYAEGVKRHFLIVCPTSVIYHWQEKLQQFLPGLRLYTFYSAERSLEDFQSGYDVLLTSYGVLRNESETLAKIPFEVAIFDEIQIAKNHSSRIHAALTKIQSRMKIGLTGTPIENYLRELKSLFDIVLPAYMPTDRNFRDLFVRPIEREGNLHRKDLLNRLVRPFILRRKKEDVLPDLPEKIEEVSHCDLMPYQRQLYAEVLAERRRHLLSELENDGTPIPYLHIFALLSSLKQICNHPAVYLKKSADYREYQSGKWELFCELLREARDSNQKVVVFSQYLGMLDIIEDYLTSHGIGYATIRGSTQDRKEQIIKFNHDPLCEVFVGSLQAAGLGVDLTAGSVVIHYDRWWNAARENQATDRVHRIGQLRGVQVFKLVTKNTFEEKIDEMIIRKGQLMEDVIGVDEHNIVKKFSREEIIDLLTMSDPGDEHPSISDED